MFYSLDRVTEGWAVMVGDDDSTLRIRQELLPPGTREGDVLRFEAGSFLPAPEETAARRKRVQEKLDALLHPGEEP